MTYGSKNNTKNAYQFREFLMQGIQKRFQRWFTTTKPKSSKDSILL